EHRGARRGDGGFEGVIGSSVQRLTEVTKTMRKTIIMTGAAIAVTIGGLIHAAAPAPLAGAAMEGHPGAARSPPEGRADVHTARGDGMTALHYAAIRHDVELAKLLLYAGANVKATTRIGGYTPLLMAARDGDAAMIDALIGAGADANSATVNGATALML